MSWMRCHCGYFQKDDDHEHALYNIFTESSLLCIYQAMNELKDNLAASKDPEQRRQAIHSALPDYPPGFEDEEVLSDRLTGLVLDHVRTFFECPACGELYVQQGNLSDQFKFYVRRGSCTALY